MVRAGAYPHPYRADCCRWSFVHRNLFGNPLLPGSFHGRDPLVTETWQSHPSFGFVGRGTDLCPCRKRPVGSGRPYGRNSLAFPRSSRRVFEQSSGHRAICPVRQPRWPFLRGTDPQSGQLRWSLALGVPIRCSPAVKDHIVVFAAEDMRVYAADILSGKLLRQSEKLSGQSFRDAALQSSLETK